MEVLLVIGSLTYIIQKMTLFKVYFKTQEENTFAKCMIHFNKDTYHWATSADKQKGYQLTCTPVTISDLGNGATSEQVTAFAGFYKIIFPVERQSKKRFEQAYQEFINFLPRILEFFKDKGYTIDEEDIKTKLNISEIG